MGQDLVNQDKVFGLYLRTMEKPLSILSIASYELIHAFKIFLLFPFGP